MPAQVEAALFEAVTRGISLTQAVNELYPELVDLLERGLDRSDFPAVHTVRPLPDVVRSLPVGMCERLLSLPVHRDSRSERIDVASVDALDGHVANEFAYHLRVPVRVLRAPFTEMVTALENLHASGIFLPGLSKIRAANRGPTSVEPPPAASLRALPVNEPSVPPIRRSLAPNPNWVADVPAFSIVEPPALDGDEALNEPVLSLGRPKPFVPEYEPVGPPWTLEFEAAVRELDAADTPERVVSSLCEGLSPVRALVLAVRNSSFDVRGGSAGLGAPADLRLLSVPMESGGLLDTATRVGFFLGPFAVISALSSLEGKWSAPAGSDCYARTVNVSGRPSLIVLMVGFSESTEATRRADVLARAAGSALERIVRTRKRG
ncbi:MAG TPA: hypothetical protein VFK05_16930 [Polyangiaceae bacterium]|nr:hypothetical protein [Polyangiaceae bacterium]